MNKQVMLHASSYAATILEELYLIGSVKVLSL